MAFSSAEQDIRQTQFTDMLERRNTFNDFIQMGDVSKQARPGYFGARNEGVFSGQARNVAAQTRLALDRAMTGLHGLGGGIGEQQMSAIAGTQIGQIGGLRAETTARSEAQGSAAEMRLMSMLESLSKMDQQLLTQEREYAVRAWEEGVNPYLEGGRLNPPNIGEGLVATHWGWSGGKGVTSGRAT